MIAPARSLRRCDPHAGNRSARIVGLLPGIATAIGCWFLVRFVRNVVPAFYPVALAGGVSVTCGGLAKARWKLIRALDGPDLKWLDASLFSFLA